MKSTIHIHHRIQSHLSDKALFQNLQNIDSYYLQLSPAHRAFKVTHGSLEVEGSQIENEESVWGQTVTHHYIIQKIDPNRHIQLVSNPSRVTIWGLFKMSISTTVDFIITPTPQGATLTSTLTLNFGSRLKKQLALAAGTRWIWQHHLKEELENGKKIFEQN